MKRILAFTWALFAGVAIAAAANPTPTEISLWPDGAPTDNGLKQQTETNVDGRIGSVSDPVLYVFPAKNPNGKMVIACPGGGYAYLAMDHEGLDMAGWMNDMGVTFAVLKYRMPNGHSTVTIEDARQAMDLARRNARQWGVDPGKIGIMGSSAGGHFAATAATMYGDRKFRPDFQILLYPVISMDSTTHRGSRDNLLGKEATSADIERFSLQNRVTPDTPPAFVALSADDDIVPPVNSLGYAEALMENKVPASLHVYPTGGHGWGFRDSFKYKPEWTAELKKWLSEL